MIHTYVSWDQKKQRGKRQGTVQAEQIWKRWDCPSVPCPSPSSTASAQLLITNTHSFPCQFSSVWQLQVKSASVLFMQELLSSLLIDPHVVVFIALWCFICYFVWPCCVPMHGAAPWYGKQSGGLSWGRRLDSNCCFLWTATSWCRYGHFHFPLSHSNNICSSVNRLNVILDPGKPSI